MSGMEYHPNFDRYVEMIVRHPNYKGLYYDRGKDGRVNWVVTGKSQKGQLRQAWWDAKCKELGVPIQKGCYAKVARLIHPTGKHVCQCCGKERSIFYEYPTLRTLSKINALFGTHFGQANYTIKEIIIRFCENPKDLNDIAAILHLPKPKDKTDLIEAIYRELVRKESKYFSPGVMCNPPDRFNGFHSYALCCRKVKDRGRHDDNMKTYTQDRRAYENWSDGDYNLANRLMGEFHKQPEMQCPQCGKVERMTADHIGPVSLGFCHSKYLTPLCSGCNSAKNNRFTKSDVDRLVALEKQGEIVISWHSKYIWDLLKTQINNDIDAKKASSVMAKCHQNVLYILSLIYKYTGKDFLLRYLHPEYSMVDYRFENIDISHLDRLKIIAKPLDSKNKRKNQERYLRIAFDSLSGFGVKENRKNYFLIDENSQDLMDVVKSIKEKRYEEAHNKLYILINVVSQEIYEIEYEQKRYSTKLNFDSQMAAEPNDI